ncbi:hypothetical protein M885DRAFT_511073 [Pelagophyceae sp. CCMP2097]|nr:hypothetical protein M885DRAFT_511073 [Pelagophyceae sp. CCMP2097]|mmetsp:Transcript_10852/g.36205  ORF Transcript_10852/g.36205 Transcript_10852/m.36205 type:complete len:181 (+) Transcript_10852:795-1337(+)
MVVDLATCADAAAQRPRIALELGAGTALVGFVAAAVGLADEIFLTDCRPAVLANLRCGAALNAEVLRSAVSVQVLDFSTDSILADLVLAADCVCSDADAFSLAACLSRCVAPAGRALVVLAEAKHRYGVEKFAPACAALGLAVDIEIVEPAASETPLLAAASGWTPGMTFGVYRITWPVS